VEFRPFAQGFKHEQRQRFEWFEPLAVFYHTDQILVRPACMICTDGRMKFVVRIPGKAGATTLIAFGVFEYAAGTRKSLPGFAMAFGAESRRGHHIFRLEPAAPALKLEDGGRGLQRWIRVVCREMTFRPKSFHADGHCNAPSIRGLRFSSR
jgi:hypothetical protein